MKRSLITYLVSNYTPVQWTSLAVVCLSVIGAFSGLLPLGSWSISIISAVLFIIALDCLQQEKARITLKKELLNEFHGKFNEITDLMKMDSVGIITEISQTKVFRDFFGEHYHAYNAPMQYELDDLEERIKFHIARYQDHNFKMAFYYYPIFSLQEPDELQKWMQGIYQFYFRLYNDSRLTTDQKLKVTFFVPKQSSNHLSDYNITYFMGKTSRGNEAVIYIHNNIFMDLNRRNPKVMFIIYSEKLMHWLLTHRRDTTHGMIEIIGIKPFLDYLEGRLDHIGLQNS